SYLDYSMSVIIGRAIPDVRDGCKPVQRRILYSMAQNNFYHNRPHFKCARIVGDCMGKYHPHGDQSVYQALVRLAQNFSVRYMLIDGQGNFGSVDGDSAAAMRYTEARLAQISELMLDELDKDTVDFQDNFDGSLKEPVYLSARLPLLLMNGASGIAVGMSTNMAPHNLNEITDAICAAIDMGVDKFNGTDVEKFIKGPDFPTGGIIMGRQGIKDAIYNGRGAIVLRGKCEIVPNGTAKNRDSIIITELPYTVNKSSLIKKIANLVNNKVIPEISDVRDESDRTGMRVVIELKKNSDANACLNRLYNKTQLQSTFNIINLALINNGRQPKVLSYSEIIKEFIAHREKVIRRRTTFELKKAERRMQIIEGLLIAINNIDAVVQLIKKSKSTNEAAKNLMTNYSLTDLQVSEILKMPLSRLTNMQTQKLVDEKNDLVNIIKNLKTILGDQNQILSIIKKESIEITKKYGDERRTEIREMEAESKITYKETVPEEECVIVITQDQKVKRMTLQQYQAQGRGGKGKRGMKMREEDIIAEMFIASSHDTILLFTQQGRVYSVPAFKFPLASRNARGKAIINYVNLQPGEKIIDITNIENFSDEKKTLVFVSAKGITKKTELNAFSKIRKTGIRCITIREDDKLVRVKICNPKEEILIATKNGFAIRFKENELRASGRTAMGVKGITLRSDDEVVDAVVHDPDTSIVTITKKGRGKHTKLNLYRLTHRGGKGVINIKLRSEDDEVIAVKAVPSEKNLLLASVMGLLIRIRTEDIRETGRATMGVIVMRFSSDDDEISSVALCDPEEPIC
ncbi:MAG: DNA gyrase subunit A, partial [Promethearchaeota archaeon]